MDSATSFSGSDLFEDSILNRCFDLIACYSISCLYDLRLIWGSFMCLEIHLLFRSQHIGIYVLKAFPGDPLNLLVSVQCLPFHI